MRLLLVRHGIAEDRADDMPDEQRELTREGAKRMRRAARGLAAIAPRPDLVATSPLLRARQTASLILREMGDAELVVLEQLVPLADPRDIAEWLARRRDEETIVLVGHEPHLGALLTWLACGREASRFGLRKGGAALLDVAGPPRASSARLCWLLQPSHLRGLA